MNAEIEYAANTFGLPNPEYDTMDVSYLQKQLNIVNNEISDIQKKIQNKQAEIEAIKAGTNLSDLDRAAREEYVRTGSSAPMQSLENSRLSREMTAKTQADIDEQTLNDTEAEADNLKYTISTLYGKYLDQGKSLSNEDKEKVVSALASLKKLSSKRKGIDDDTDGDGIEDTVEKRAQELKEAPTTTTTKELPKDNADLGIKLGQLKTVEEQDALTKLYIDNHPWFTNGVLDTSKIPDTETYAKEYAKRTGGATGTGATKTTDSIKNAENAEKAKKAAYGELKEKAKTVMLGTNFTKEAWNSEYIHKRIDSILSAYNKAYKTKVSYDTLGQDIGVK